MSDELNCSDGAKMLIERMQSTPEEFKNTYDGRWRDILDCARRMVDEDDHSEVMSKRDAEAILKAHDAHILEPRLAERILNELMEPKAEKKQPNKLLTPGNMSQEMLKLLEQQYSQAYREYRTDTQSGQSMYGNPAETSSTATDPWRPFL